LSNTNSGKETILSTFSLKRIDVSEKVLQELIPVMNEIHNSNYSYRFWKIVLGDYINSVVSINHILERQELPTSPTLEGINSHSLPTFTQKIRARLPGIIRHFKSVKAYQSTNKILAEKKDITLGLPAILEVEKDLGTAIAIYYPLFSGSGNKKKREKAIAIASRYPDLFYRNVIKLIPKIYIEYFEKELSGIPLIEPASKTFHVHGLPPYFNALLIAKYIDNGAKLFCYQHGANYGEQYGHNAHFNETSVADQFRTWGWKIKENDVPWKAYRLEKFSQQYHAAPPKKEFDFLICFPDLSPINEKPYREKSAYLLEHISTDKYKNFLARPRPLNKVFSHAHKISFIKDSRVVIDSGLSSMPEIITKCRAVIQFSVPGTNFLECIYVDHPTIGLLENDQPTDVVKPHYDFLLQVGVLHSSFESLVDHLNNNNIEEWWTSVINMDGYKDFKNTFTRKV
jgi:hypothetical protein